MLIQDQSQLASSIRLKMTGNGNWILKSVTVTKIIKMEIDLLFDIFLEKTIIAKTKNFYYIKT